MQKMMRVIGRLGKMKIKDNTKDDEIYRKVREKKEV
jgi:hypothetical protein